MTSPDLESIDLECIVCALLTSTALESMDFLVIRNKNFRKRPKILLRSAMAAAMASCACSGVTVCEPVGAGPGAAGGATNSGGAVGVSTMVAIHTCGPDLGLRA